MHVTRFDEAPEYTAAGHFDMRCLRLQGHEAGPVDDIWLGASIIEPGGHIAPSASPLEKHYVVLSGMLTIATDNQVATLKAFDSCRLAPGERRSIRNESEERATVLLAMPWRAI
jgi:quercetin dioxygenase-like cupin family protein